MMSAGSGPTSREPFATYDPASCSWRTCRPSLFEDLPASSPTWPKSGTWDLGAVCERPTSAPVTVGNGSSSSPGLLPTPSAKLACDSQTHRSGARTDELLLTGIVLELGKEALLKTPTAQLAVNGGSQPPGKRRAGGH